MMHVGAPLGRYLLAAAVALGAAIACSSTDAGVRCAGASGQSYKPGDEILCKCADRTDGTRTCGADGNLSPCEPCLAQTPDDGGFFEEDAGVSDARFGCGDGTHDPDETCDDGNLKDGDLCNAKCLPYGNPTGADQCPGQEVHVWAKPVEIPDHQTIGYGNTERWGATECEMGTDRATTGVTSPNRIYAVVAHKTGSLTVTTRNADFDHMLYARRECKAGNPAVGEASNIVCANKVKGNGGESIVVPVTDGDRVYVIVDGIVATKGKYVVSFGIQ
jgi:cysteine-rich repeat protein